MQRLTWLGKKNKRARRKGKISGLPGSHRVKKDRSFTTSYKSRMGKLEERPQPELRKVLGFSIPATKRAPATKGTQQKRGAKREQKT